MMSVRFSDTGKELFEEPGLNCYNIIFLRAICNFGILLKTNLMIFKNTLFINISGTEDSFTLKAFLTYSIHKFTLVAKKNRI